MNTEQDGKLKQLESALSKLRRESVRVNKIPNDIWDGAVDLAKEVGVGLVARQLGLNHTRLKGFVGSSASLSSKPSKVAQFVELKPTPSAPSMRSFSCAIEVEGVSGSVMRARIDGITPGDLGLMIRTFGA
jgi:hypothetical protein